MHLSYNITHNCHAKQAVSLAMLLSGISCVPFCRVRILVLNSCVALAIGERESSRDRVSSTTFPCNAMGIFAMRATAVPSTRRVQCVRPRVLASSQVRDAQVDRPASFYYSLLLFFFFLSLSLDRMSASIGFTDGTPCSTEQNQVHCSPENTVISLHPRKGSHFLNCRF